MAARARRVTLRLGATLAIVGVEQFDPDVTRVEVRLQLLNKGGAGTGGKVEKHDRGGRRLDAGEGLTRIGGHEDAEAVSLEALAALRAGEGIVIDKEYADGASGFHWDLLFSLSHGAGGIGAEKGNSPPKAAPAIAGEWLQPSL